ncbi:hypothetical protein D3C79_940930 [compost metagenome]
MHARAPPECTTPPGRKPGRRCCSEGWQTAAGVSDHRGQDERCDGVLDPRHGGNLLPYMVHPFRAGSLDAQQQVEFTAEHFTLDHLGNLAQCIEHSFSAHAVIAVDEDDRVDQ